MRKHFTILNTALVLVGIAFLLSFHVGMIKQGRIDCRQTNDLYEWCSEPHYQPDGPYVGDGS